MGTIRKNKNSFTLIELLVVVALSSVLLGLGLPAFNRMLRGNKVAECAGNIKLALEQAQLRAASERRYIAVCFPNGTVDDDVEKFRLGGFRPAYVKKQSDNSYKFTGWLSDSSWGNRPSGAVLTQISTSAYTTESNGDIKGCTKSVSDSIEGGSSLKSLSDVKDDENQSLSLGNNFALIFSPYGDVVSSSNLYLLIAEGTDDGGRIVYPSTGTGDSNRSANYLVLKVNKYTGRVEYSND